MTKRKSNALSYARGKQKRHENVWFRRTGAGYRLFAEYYAAQPVGTVVMSEEKSDPAGKNRAETTAKQGQGLSRASKRRKKKKNISVDLQKEAIVEESSAEATTAFQFTNAELASHLKQFLAAMGSPLPLTFRLRLTTENADDLRKRLSEYQHFLSPLPFDSNIYQATVSKAELSSKSPALKELLITHSQDGTLARQELGSMLPVLVLKETGCLRQSSRVVDMCASPGSKTLQALEIIGEPGRIVANDVLESRLDALREAVERSGMPRKLTDRITYTKQDATQLTLRTGQWAEVVICDVPCSGDGTCRKDKHILPMWKPNYGNQLHDTQVDILVRAIQLLKVGGAVCYSTCSLNPVEDEAVVAEALRRTTTDEGSPAVELVECPDLPGLIHRKGISEWKVADFTQQDDATKDNEAEDESVLLRWHETWQDAVDANMDKPSKSMWPSRDNLSLHMERCVRLWPHDQDSGGFFLALIRKNR